jgi:hypothetical protein
MAKYRTPRECYLSVLAALENIDPQVENVKDVRIWKHADMPHITSPWGWRIDIVRGINYETFTPPQGIATHFGFDPEVKVRPLDARQVVTKRSGWQEMALLAYEEALAKEAAEAAATAPTPPSPDDSE